MNSLEFCNAVIQVSHPLVQSQLVDYVHNGFLVPVMGPALHKSSVEEMIASTAYLDLFLRSITETALLKTFLRFILLHQHDNYTILDTLITRISSNSRLCMVSLSLFRTLLSLNCEDFMLQLVLRYLLPCTHVMLSQRRAVRETDLYGKSADKFMSLIPECCRLELGTAEREEEPAYWGKGPGSPSVESPVSKPNTPSRLALFIRQQSIGSSSNAEPPQSPNRVGTISPESPMHQGSEQGDMESGYIEYLRDAQKNIEFCAWACRSWSAPYDGEDPSPISAPPPPPLACLNINAEHLNSQQVMPNRPRSDSAERKPSQQQTTNRSKPDWESTEQDSGEWDITIGKNSIIVTPRTKKRSLQREMPNPPSPTSSSSLLPGASARSYPLGQGEDHPIFNGIRQVVTNSTEGQDGGMEVKKVRRDSGENSCGGHNGAQDEILHPDTSEHYPENCQGSGELQVSQRSLGSEVTKGILGSQVPKGLLGSQVSQVSYGSQLREKELSALSERNVPTRSLESVESLIEELLDRAPGEANGSGISIEAFSQELKELEETVREQHAQRGQEEPGSANNGSQGGVCAPLPSHKEEEERPPTHEQELADTGSPKLKNVPTLFSPTRTLGQPLSQPYTGPGSPSVESPVSKPNTPSRLALFIRQQSIGSSSNAEPPQSPNRVGTISPESPMHQGSEQGDMESGYIEYLRDAQKNIEFCAWACRSWSAPYDGEDPSPISAPPPPPLACLNINAEHLNSQQVMPNRPRSDSAERKPSQQQTTNRSKPDWESTEQDSGEWDITIGKNSIIVTPRTKKRSLQREMPNPPSPTSSSSLLPGASARSYPLGQGEDHPIFNGIRQVVTNSTEGQDGGMEVKKVRRDSGENSCGGHNGAQDEILHPDTSEHYPENCQGSGELQVSQRSLGSEVTKGILGSQVPKGLLGSQVSQVSYGSQLREKELSALSERNVPTRSLESVESLIEELLDRAPGEANGSGISIEAFSQELKELEETVREQHAQRGQEEPGSANNGSQGGVCAPLPSHKEEEERPPTHEQELADTGSPKLKNVPTLFSPTRTLGQPLSQPYTVKSRKPSLGELILRHTNSPTRARQAAQMAFAHVRDGGQVLHSALFRGSTVGTVERQNEALRVKNAVYCGIIFSEFLKELAALAQEHAVTTPFPRCQDTEE
ncbi:UNVERIFIED_CONTAM: hypothetical protein FKN15_025975 [Acipenser sinensis]